MSRKSAAAYRSGVSLLLAAALLAACSSTQFFYNRLDTVIAWYVDDYVEFDRDQEPLFDTELAAFFEWHRREELPQYVALLEAFETALDKDIDAATADHFARALRAAVERLQVRALDAMLVVGEALRPEQLAEVMAALERDQQDADWVDRSDNEYRADARERLVDNLEDYLGRLNEAQRARVRAGVDAYIRLDRVWLADRGEWLTTLGALLRDPVTGWPEQVRAAVAARRAGRGAEFQRQLDHNAIITRDILRDVVNLRSERQDRRLRRKIADLREDFAALIPAGDG